MVRIYEEEWTGWTGWSRYMNSDLRGVRIYEEEWTGWMKSLVWYRLV